MKKRFTNIYNNYFNKPIFHKDLHSISIQDWFELNEGNMDKILVKGICSNDKKFNAYLDLLQVYNNEFGTSEEHKNFVKTKHRYAIAIAKNLISQNGETLMNLEMAKEDLLSLKPQNIESEKQSLNDYLVFIEKNMKFEIKESISTHKFYTYLKNIKNG